MLLLQNVWTHKGFCGFVNDSGKRYSHTKNCCFINAAFINNPIHYVSGFVKIVLCIFKNRFYSGFVNYLSTQIYYNTAYMICSNIYSYGKPMFRNNRKHTGFSSAGRFVFPRFSYQPTQGELFYNLQHGWHTQSKLVRYFRLRRFFFFQNELCYSAFI